MSSISYRVSYIIYKHVIYVHHVPCHVLCSCAYIGVSHINQESCVKCSWPSHMLGICDALYHVRLSSILLFTYALLC